MSLFLCTADVIETFDSNNLHTICDTFFNFLNPIQETTESRAAP